MEDNPQCILETSRTWMRHLTIDDAEFFYALNNDPLVMQYTGDAAFQDQQAARDFLAHYDQYAKYGVGRMAVLLKENNECIGWCGLKFHPDTNQYDIGFRFFRNYWGQGYATETAKAVVDYGFRQLQLSRIIGRAMKENNASIKVLEKCGMTYVQESACGGEPGVLYVIDNNL